MVGVGLLMRARTVDVVSFTDPALLHHPRAMKFSAWAGIVSTLIAALTLLASCGGTEMWIPLAANRPAVVREQVQFLESPPQRFFVLFTGYGCRRLIGSAGLLIVSYSLWARLVQLELGAHLL
jgi:hypothetical protein